MRLRLIIAFLKSWKTLGVYTLVEGEMIWSLLRKFIRLNMESETAQILWIQPQNKSGKTLTVSIAGGHLYQNHVNSVSLKGVKLNINYCWSNFYRGGWKEERIMVPISSLVDSYWNCGRLFWLKFWPCSRLQENLIKYSWHGFLRALMGPLPDSHILTWVVWGMAS